MGRKRKDSEQQVSSSVLGLNLCQKTMESFQAMSISTLVPSSVPSVEENSGSSGDSMPENIDPTASRYFGGEVAKLGCGCRVMHYYQHLLTFHFVIDEINQNTEILPNITLGFQIYDSCSDIYFSLCGVMSILSGPKKPVPGYACHQQGHLAGFIGSFSSKISHSIARLTGIYRYPQISYGFTETSLNDQVEFPFFYRTFPNDYSDYYGMIQLLKVFGWSWVGILTSYDENDVQLSEDLKREIIRSGTCVDFVESLPSDNLSPASLNLRLAQISAKINNSTANVIIIHTTTVYTIYALCTNDLKIMDDKILIFTAKSSSVQSVSNEIVPSHCTIFNGSLMITIPKGEIPGFKHFRQTVDPSKFQETSLQDYDVDHFPFTYSLYNMVYALAHALNNLYIAKSQLGESLKMEFQPWQLYFSFFLPQVLQSVCSKSCVPGYRKILDQNKLVCCFDCVVCSEGEYSNTTDAENCMKCPEDQWPNEKKDGCLPRIIEFLSYDDSLGIALSSISIFLIIINALVLGIFIKYRDTPVVKANNRNLSYILLISLKMSFLCSFVFINSPGSVTCLLRQTAFAIIFTVAVSSVLAKTITVAVAFNAAKPSSKLRKWVGTRVSSYLVLLCSSGEFVICIVWLFISPPYPEYDTQSEIGKMILQCNEGSTIAFYSVIGYIGFLAILSFVVAFLVRKLPDSFNEAQFITFSMLVFCSVWVSFIPAYLSTKGKYMVAVEIFAILSSSAGLLGCIFIPKCYIILLRPDLNTRGHVIGKQYPKIA
uniref:G-protein coupled receptor family C group 6 member A-like n=1 Tax=Geotrypetes seraphini TaxID=260995 RepID=A0A6P8NSF9_GEOSA|nr:G-protein coupled receptor family C group 6 member A-like [Geotrypetes seraphini]